MIEPPQLLADENARFILLVSLRRLKRSFRSRSFIRFCRGAIRRSLHALKRLLLVEPARGAVAVSTRRKLATMPCRSIINRVRETEENRVDRQCVFSGGHFE